MQTQTNKTARNPDFVARVRGALIEASLKEGARFLAGLPVRLGRIVFRWVESGAAGFLPF